MNLERGAELAVAGLFFPAVDGCNGHFLEVMSLFDGRKWKKF